MSHTKISEIGQFAFIDRITKDFPLSQPTSVLGVGDDAAILHYDGADDLLFSSELLLEGIHFDLAYTPLEHLGYKAAVITIMDIYAMGGVPQQLNLSLGITSRFSVEHIEEIYRGLRRAAEEYQFDLVGGDTSASVTGLALATSVVGRVAQGGAIKRSSARETELLCVTGDLGAAYMGLQLLERERQVFLDMRAEEVNPDFSGKEYLIERQLKPMVPLKPLRALRERSLIPTAMIDISDGLASELLQLAKSSKVGIRLWEDRIPIDYQTAALAEEMNLNVTTVALNGGEDYELLMSFPLEWHDQLREIEGLHLVGHVTAPSLGVAMVTRDGQEISLSAPGWVQEVEDHDEA